MIFIHREPVERAWSLYKYLGGIQIEQMPWVSRFKSRIRGHPHHNLPFEELFLVLGGVEAVASLTGALGLGTAVDPCACVAADAGERSRPARHGHGLDPPRPPAGLHEHGDAPGRPWG